MHRDYKANSDMLYACKVAHEALRLGKCKLGYRKASANLPILDTLYQQNLELRRNAAAELRDTESPI